MKILSVVARDNAEMGSVIDLRKWEDYYRRLGVEVHRVTGDPDLGEAARLGANYHIVPSISPSSPLTVKSRIEISKAPGSFLRDDAVKRLESAASRIQADLIELILGQQIDAMHIDALVSYPICLPFNLILKDLLETTGLRAVSRSHNFLWEGALRGTPYLNSIVGVSLPPVSDRILHLVLTSIAERSARQRVPELQTRVVPNLFRTPPPIDTHNSARFRATLGISAEHLMVLQPTRTIPSKCVHLTVHAAAMLAELTNRRATVVLTASSLGLGGGSPNEVGDRYMAAVEGLARDLGVGIVHAGGLPHCSGSTHDSFCIYDAYYASDLIGYMAVSETFGNPVIEAMLAGTPIIVGAYPVAVEQFQQDGLAFPIVQSEPPESVTSTSWAYDIRSPPFNKSEIQPIAELLSGGYRETSVARSNLEIAQDRYVISDEIIERHVQPVIDWLAEQS